MEEKILQFINSNPGTRKRYIASSLGVGVSNSSFMRAMRNLTKEGKICYVAHHDPAQMEFYDEWYIKI